MTEPKEAAVVTRADRDAARVAFYGDTPSKHLQILRWIETGEVNAGISETLPRIAEAIARGRAQASGFDEQVAADLAIVRRHSWAGSHAALDRIEKRLRGER